MGKWNEEKNAQFLLNGTLAKYYNVTPPGNKNSASVDMKEDKLSGSHLGIPTYLGKATNPVRRR